MKKFKVVLIAITVLALLPSLSDAAQPKLSFSSWALLLAPTKRFKVLSDFGGAAVQDNETGLVWEQSPSTATFSWSSAQDRCNRLVVGDRLGWRLPTVQELASLIDPTQATPALPTKHPFSNVQSSIGSFYWSSSTVSGIFQLNHAYDVTFFNNGAVNTGNKFTIILIETADSDFVWCVRTGQGVEPGQ